MLNQFTKRIFIIAEAGVNHNGDVRLAKKLVEAAYKAGADAVKFQTFNAERLVTASAPKAKYQKKTTAAGESQLAMLKKLELSAKDHQVLMDLCRRKGILFMSSPFDEESADFLIDLGVKILKIPSGEITNRPFLQHVAQRRCSIVLSTGMSTLAEVKEAVDILREQYAPLALLHCVSQYPAPFEQLNLRAVKTLADTFGVPAGFSDHTPGTEAAVAAVALGARIIEKHLTLDKNMKGPDHKASLNPAEFAQMVKSIRNIEKALGDGIKKPAPCEIDTRRVARKSIVAAVPIKRGEIFSERNLTVKRPGNGLSPARWAGILGRRSPRDFKINELIQV